MGDEVRQGKAIILEVTHRLIEELGEEYLEAGSDDERKALADMSVFVLASLLAALRGEETLKISLGNTRDYFEEAKKNLQLKHVVIPLRGSFKGENGEGYHFVAVSAFTNSRFKIRP